jgi:hypothetical protein
MNNFFQQFFQNTIDLATFYTTDKEEPITLAAGIYDTAALMAAGISNNSIYRVDMPPGFTITLFSEDTFSGDKLQLTSSSSSLGKLDKATSSLIIRDPSEDENNSVTSTEENVTESTPATEEGTVTESTPATEEETVTESTPVTESEPITEEETVTESEPITERETVTEGELDNEEGELDNEEGELDNEEERELDNEEEDSIDYDTDLIATIYSRDSDGNDLEPISLRSGEYNSQAIFELGIMNDGIYKIDVPNGLKVTLFSEDDFSGSSYFVTSDAMVDLVEPTYSIIVENNIFAKNIMISPTPSTESTPAPYKSKSTSKLPHLNFPGNFNYINEISLSQIPTAPASQISVQSAIRVPKSQRVPKQVQSQRAPKQVQSQRAPKQVQSQRAPKQVQSERVQTQRLPKQVQTKRVPIPPKPAQTQRVSIPPKPVQRVPIPPKPVQRVPIPPKPVQTLLVPIPSVQIEPDEIEQDEIEEDESGEIFPSIVPSIYKEFDIVVKSNFGADLIPDVSNTNLLIIILVFILLAIILR